MLDATECTALAAKLGLRFDGLQDPCGGHEATGDPSHLKLAFTCIKPGPAQGFTFYAAPSAEPDTIADLWNAKLAEIFADEYRKVCQQRDMLEIDNKRLQALVDAKCAGMDNLRRAMNALRARHRRM